MVRSVTLTRRLPERGAGTNEQSDVARRSDDVLPSQEKLPCDTGYQPVLAM